MPRIVMPKNKAATIKLAQTILNKHQADGAASPLAGLNLADMTAKTALAATQNELSEKLHRDAETATQSCDNALGPDYTTPGGVNFYLASVRDILSGLHKGNEQKLGDWGFEVAQSVKTAARKTNAPKTAHSDSPSP